MIQSFKTMADLGKALLGMRDAALIREKVIELNGEILSAQASALATQAVQSALLNRVRELEKKVADHEAWDAEREKYKLAKMSQWTDVLDYTLTVERDTSEPSHFLCTNCFEDRVKSVLQPETRQPFLCQVLMCPRCGSDFYVTGQWHPEHAPRKTAKRAR